MYMEVEGSELLEQSDAIYLKPSSCLTYYYSRAVHVNLNTPRQS